MIVRVGVGVGLNGECCKRPDRERVTKALGKDSGQLCESPAINGVRILQVVLCGDSGGATGCQLVGNCLQL